MLLDIVFKNLDKSDAIEEVVRHKSEKLTKFFHGDFHLTWTLSVLDKTDHHAELHLHRKGLELHASDDTDDLYKTLDSVLQKMKHQLEKHKEIVIDHHHNKIGHE